MTSEKTDVGHGSALPPYYSPHEGHPAPQASYYPEQGNYPQQQGSYPQPGNYQQQQTGYPPVIEAQPTHFHTTNTTVVVSQPAMTAAQQRPRQWSTGLCGCCEDCGICWHGMCFPQCLLCDVSSRMGEGCCFPFCCPMALAGLRVKLRTEENIQGSACDDYFCAMCCPSLVLCQLARELRHVGK